MIRQSVSCDICGTEKRQTNHWFVACEQAGELRLSGWSSRNRSRAGSKHLCGQTCLHKLVDEFMARSLSARPAAAEPPIAEKPPVTDTSLTANTPYTGEESSARLLAPLPPVQPVLPIAVPRPARGEVPARFPVESAVATLDEAPEYSSAKRRVEAWQRERVRELSSAKSRFATAPRGSHS